MCSGECAAVLHVVAQCAAGRREHDRPAQGNTGRNRIWFLFSSISLLYDSFIIYYLSFVHFDLFFILIKALNNEILPINFFLLFYLVSFLMVLPLFEYLKDKRLHWHYQITILSFVPFAF